MVQKQLSHQIRCNLFLYKNTHLSRSMEYLLVFPMILKLYFSFDLQMTGGTPEVRSDKGLTLLTFDI